MKKIVIFLSLVLAFTVIKASAITPKEAYQQICDIPTMQQTMPVTQFELGSKMVFIGAQTVGSVATQPKDIKEISEDVGKILSEIPNEYFITGVVANNGTVLYYASPAYNDLYDVLCINIYAPDGYCQATLAQAPASTINELKELEAKAQSNDVSASHACCSK